MSNWQNRAACRNTVIRGVITSPADDLFFPKGNTALAARARAYCDLCPVRAECEAEYQTLPDARQASVWGGQLHEPAVADRTDMAIRRRALYDQGLSDTEIAATEGVNRTSIRMWRTARSLPANPQAPYKPQTDRRIEWHAWGWTDREMAAQEHISIDSIGRWRERHGLARNGDPVENQRAG